MIWVGFIPLTFNLPPLKIDVSAIDVLCQPVVWTSSLTANLICENISKSVSFVIYKSRHANIFTRNQLSVAYTHLYHLDNIAAIAYFSAFKEVCYRQIGACPEFSCKTGSADNIRIHNYMTPVLEALHWLPVEYWIEYEILLLTFKTLHEFAPAYIKGLICPYNGPVRCLNHQRTFFPLLGEETQWPVFSKLE